MSVMLEEPELQTSVPPPVPPSSVRTVTGGDDGPLYTCPFCKMKIPDGIEYLAEHRKPGGECEQNQSWRGDPFG